MQRTEGDPAPPGEPALVFYGTAAIQKPFGDGFLLVARSPSQRLGSGIVDAHGRFDLVVDFAAVGSSSLPIVAGSTNYFQAWVSDPNGPGGHGFNLSTAAAVTFVP